MGIDPYRTLTILVTSMLILASQSPRRRSLLAMLGLDFAVDTADIDETMDPTLPPETEVARLSEAKARAVEQKHPGDLILTADTVVVVDGCVLGKPRDAEEAKAHLRRLSGRSHTVMTAFCLLQNGLADVHVEKTHLHFKPLSEGEIAAYVASGSPMDKAGAYGIQDQAAVFVRAIEGDYYNVMGLPLCALVQCLRRRGVAVLGTVEP